MIFYTYIRTELIRIFIIISSIFNEFHTVKRRYLIVFIPRPKDLGDIAMSLASVRSSVRPPIRTPVRPSTFSCPLNDLNTVWNILMILHCNVEQVMTMCRVQK